MNPPIPKKCVICDAPTWSDYYFCRECYYKGIASPGDSLTGIVNIDKASGCGYIAGIVHVAANLIREVKLVDGSKVSFKFSHNKGECAGHEFEASDIKRLDDNPDEMKQRIFTNKVTSTKSNIIIQGNILQLNDGTKVPLIIPPYCEVCMENPIPDGTLRCKECIQNPPNYDKVIALGKYLPTYIKNEAERAGLYGSSQLIYDAKQRNVNQKLENTKILGEGMAWILINKYPEDLKIIDVVIHVPKNGENLTATLNHSFHYATNLARLIDKPFDPNIIIENSTQIWGYDKNSPQRFSLSCPLSKISQKIILVADDVHTHNGEDGTHENIARLLKKNGARKVFICVAGRTTRQV